MLVLERTAEMTATRVPYNLGCQGVPPLTVTASSPPRMCCGHLARVRDLAMGATACGDGDVIFVFTVGAGPLYSFALNDAREQAAKHGAGQDFINAIYIYVKSNSTERFAIPIHFTLLNTLTYIPKMMPFIYMYVYITVLCSIAVAEGFLLSLPNVFR